MRRLLALALVLSLGVLPVLATAGSDVRTSLVVCTTTRSHLVAGYANRQDLLVQNVGTLHVAIGRGTVMTTLHAGANLGMENYQGGLDCQTQPGTGSTTVEIFEVLRP